MKSIVVRVVGIVVVAVCGVWLGQVAGTLIANPGGPQREVQENLLPSLIVGTDSAGAAVTLGIADTRRPVVLFALSVDCPYCRRNLPNWRAIARSLGGDNESAEIVVLSISPPEETTAYLQANNLPTNTVFVDKSELEALGLRGVPGTIAITPGEQIARKWVGVLESEDVSLIAAWAHAHRVKFPGIEGS